MSDKLQQLFCSTLLMLFMTPVSALTADEYVIKADSYRQTAEQMKVSTKIRLYKGGELDKEKHYTVFIKPGRKSLVVFRTPGEKGQKVLMLGDRFWLLMPKSKRPIRITPMQKLLGEASTGDIATMNWHEDYSAVMESPGEVNGIKVDSLYLTAKVKGAGYRNIRLSLEQGSQKPVRAKLYVASGKLAKIAEFVMGEREGRPQVVKMVLTDRIQKNKVTEVHYEKSESYSLADKYYNPAYLAKRPKETIE